MKSFLQENLGDPEDFDYCCKNDNNHIPKHKKKQKKLDRWKNI